LFSFPGHVSWRCLFFPPALLSPYHPAEGGKRCFCSPFFRPPPNGVFLSPSNPRPIQIAILFTQTSSVCLSQLYPQNSPPADIVKERRRAGNLRYWTSTASLNPFFFFCLLRPSLSRYTPFYSPFLPRHTPTSPCSLLFSSLGSNPGNRHGSNFGPLGFKLPSASISRRLLSVRKQNRPPPPPHRFVLALDSPLHSKGERRFAPSPQAQH